MLLRSVLFAVLGIFLTVAVEAQTGTGKTAEENYKATCLPCHMADGNAALEPMNFADGKWKHGPAAGELAKVIANGVPGTAMMPFKTKFSEQEILALAKYVRHFDKKLKDAPAKTVKKKTASKP
jgi:mono/diheme cytochrome c family protein